MGGGWGTTGTFGGWLENVSVRQSQSRHVKRSWGRKMLSEFKEQSAGQCVCKAGSASSSGWRDSVALDPGGLPRPHEGIRILF